MHRKPISERMLTTRQAADYDLAFLTDLFLRAIRINIAAARGFWDEALERNQFLEQLQLHQTQIVKYHGKGIGFLMTLERGHEIELHTLCIAPEYQRCGFGTVIIRRFLEDANAHKRDAVLSVLKVNTAACSFYERFGFVVIEESTHHHRMRHVA
jgi:ribosomal protein S18 acetylase RimI-like enzyme